ncbi:MAG: NAD(P)/FAD-dependent oxidoreductase [Hungatella sp.]
MGCAVARELSRYQLSICLVEKEEDVCAGTSKANSAIIHAGHDAVPGSLKARFNIEGNRMMEQLALDLDFDFKRNGSLVLCLTKEELPALQSLYEKGIQNGVPGLTMISGEEAKNMESNLSESVLAALYAPTGGIVCPFGLTIALAENACDNGVEFRLETEVRTVEKSQKGYRILLNDGEISAAYVVNAAGVYGDVFHNKMTDEKIHITARKGEYCLLDKETGNHVSHTVFQLPNKFGKGVLVTPTVHGNLLIGPTAVDIEDKECTATTAEGLAEVMTKAAVGVEAIPVGQVITSFTGLRAHEDGDDFMIGEIAESPGFFDAVGIESPGLTSAPAIGVYLAALIAKQAKAEKKKGFQETRTGILRPQRLSREERVKLIQEKPEYGTIICRCEGISEGELCDAIHRTLGARSLDALKRRVRTGMGRCQAGFCTPKTMEILSGESGIPVMDICKNSSHSRMIIGQKQEESV